jgi:site-specific DNA-cytosine methylase
MAAAGARSCCESPDTEAVSGAGAGGGALRAVELFSGLGGLHVGVALSGVRVCVSAAFDVNAAANEAYRLNAQPGGGFAAAARGQGAASVHGTRVEVFRRDIRSLRPGDATFDAHLARAEVLLLSPPCQPYSRRRSNPVAAVPGLDRSGKSDARADGLHHVVDLLAQGALRPRALLLENVLGFEESEAFRRLSGALESRGYHWSLIVLSPTMLGIPNGRSRCFLMARDCPFGVPGWAFSLVQELRPGQRRAPREEPALHPAGAGSVSAAALKYVVLGMGDTMHAIVNEQGVDARGLATEPMLASLARRKAEGGVDTSVAAAGSAAARNYECSPLRDFLEEDSMSPAERAELLVPPLTLWKAGNMFRVAYPGSQYSDCVTKSYGKFQLGAGSVLCAAPELAALSEAEARPLVDRAVERFWAQRNAYLAEWSSSAAAAAAETAAENKAAGPSWEVAAAKEGGCPLLEPLQLRYLSPREIANLLGFPQEYLWPATMTRAQQFALLGNSLSPKVVGLVLRYMFHAEP